MRTLTAVSLVTFLSLGIGLGGCSKNEEEATKSSASKSTKDDKPASKSKKGKWDSEERMAVNLKYCMQPMMDAQKAKGIPESDKTASDLRSKVCSCFTDGVEANFENEAEANKASAKEDRDGILTSCMKK
ncbi:MAG: hypothetical protein IPJ34_25240 [Myxococcales bacterium]|nr:hypothetical protein [Myxococcales bacterium]